MLHFIDSRNIIDTTMMSRFVLGPLRSQDYNCTSTTKVQSVEVSVPQAEFDEAI